MEIAPIKHPLLRGLREGQEEFDIENVDWSLRALLLTLLPVKWYHYLSKKLVKAPIRLGVSIWRIEPFSTSLPWGLTMAEPGDLA